MSTPPPGSDPGWYRSDDDPPGMHRYWDGEEWIGDAQPIPADPRADRSPTVAGTDHPLAPGGLRILARVIDLVVLTVAFVIIARVVDGDLADDGPSGTAQLISFGVAAFYEIALVATMGGTVGKLVLGLRIVDATGASPPDGGTAFRRWAPLLITALPALGQLATMAILVLSLAWIFSDAERRSLFDRTGRTHVVAIR